MFVFLCRYITLIPKIGEETGIRDVFVGTDDFKSVQKIKNSLPEYRLWFAPELLHDPPFPFKEMLFTG